MSDEQPINPCTIPQFTGDLEALEKDRASLTSAAGTFRDAGANVDSEFQGLSAFYSAPEAAQLFATTNPVRTDSDFFADQLDSAAKALGEYVTEARPIVAASEGPPDEGGHLQQQDQRGRALEGRHGEDRREPRSDP
ncbi:hypothetical protein [Streptomyces sp. MJM1172]|uniref:hypothetical protein n=1 Tax=Streptomyces sp. MJM1172 TaxID=1703926 RepID=UPI00093A0859|nr:hypothetical protein [Streptomyces sp. MJM1172]